MKVVITGLDRFRRLLAENNGSISRELIDESMKRALEKRAKQEMERRVKRLKMMSILYHMGE
jgi:hypothetical protein